MDDWGTDFAAFTTYHTVVVSLLLTWIGCAVALGVLWRGTARERILSRVWGTVILLTMTYGCAFWIFMHFRDAEKYPWKFVLPLQICDLMPFVAGLALVTRSRTLESVTVFWGLGLCSQAFVTPIISVGYTHFHFWYFWISHTYIIGTGIYLVVVHEYRPSWRDYRVGVLTAIAYTTAMVPVDYFTGWNYAFVGQEDRPNTALDYLGPWPWRLPVLGVCVCTAMLIVKGLLWLLPTPPKRPWNMPSGPLDTQANRPGTLAP